MKNDTIATEGDRHHPDCMVNVSQGVGCTCKDPDRFQFIRRVFLDDQGRRCTQFVPIAELDRRDLMLWVRNTLEEKLDG